jgi:hypothetical protein
MGDNAGPLLLRAGLITQTQLHDAYLARGRGGGTLGEWLVAIGALDEERLCTFYCERLLVPRVGHAELAKVVPRVVARIPGDMAAEFRAVPVSIDAEQNLVLAMADPSDTHAVDEISFFTGATVIRTVAPVTAIAWALARYYGIELQHLKSPTVRPAAAKKRAPAVIVEDVFGEDTPLPDPVPMQDTGSVRLIAPEPLSPDRPRAGPVTPAPHVPAPQVSSPEAEDALVQALAALEVADDRDTVAMALVQYLRRLCRRTAFFVVRKGQLAGWLGVGIGVRTDVLREATLPLDQPSTFRDVIQTRLPYRGPVADHGSRDLLIDALGWAPADMLAVPISVRDKVVGILYGDERIQPLPDEHLTQVARAAETALHRALAARRPG